jgi:hypothetical protein
MICAFLRRRFAASTLRALSNGSLICPLRFLSTSSHRPLAWPVKEGAEAYGEPNFAELRKIGAFHSDRSRYIRLLDRKRGVVFLRPPRFGKTALLSMLEHYYDVNFKDRFDELFAGMDIHRDDTRDKTRQGGFYVLKVTLPASLGENAYVSFGDRVNGNISAFLSAHPDVMQAYRNDPPLDFINRLNFVDSLTRLNEVVSIRLGGTLMVLVDEYDRAPMSALLPAEGGALDTTAYDRAKAPLRDFLSALKEIHSIGAHFFVTGITPVAMVGESVWNIASHLTFRTEFADMLGLTRADVEAGLRHVTKIEDEVELKRALKVAALLCDGTHFSNSKQGLFNPQMVIKFLELYRSENLRVRIQDDDNLSRNLALLLDENQEISQRQARLVAAHDSLRILLTKRADPEATDVRADIHQTLCRPSASTPRRSSTTWAP